MVKKRKRSQTTKPSLKVVLFSNYHFADPWFLNEFRPQLEKERQGPVEMICFHDYLNGNCEEFYRETSGASLLLTGRENFDWQRDDYLSRLQAEEELYTLVAEAKRRNPNLLVMSVTKDYRAPVDKIAESINAWDDPLVIQAIREL